jgi:hypothetical protein
LPSIAVSAISRYRGDRCLRRRTDRPLRAAADRGEAPPEDRLHQGALPQGQCREARRRAEGRRHPFPQARIPPPLVFAGEARKLKKQLAAVANGEAFLLQGGDCAESFAEHGADNIRDFFRAFLQMSVVLTYAGALPVVKVGAFAGQFAKPRSRRWNELNGVELPSYRGDIINGIEFTPESRMPDPQRQLMAYRQSAATLNLLRAFATGRLRQPREACTSGCSASSRIRQPAGRYKELADRISRRWTSCAPAASISESHPPAVDRFLHQPRSAAARLRAGLDPRRFDDGRLVRDLRPHDLDRRPHAPARSCPCRILPWHQEPDRPEVRPVAEAGRTAEADRPAQPRQRARPPDADATASATTRLPSICRS